MKIDFRMEEKLKIIITFLIELMRIAIYLFFACIIIFGSVSSFILLYKMYPDSFVELGSKFLIILKIFVIVIRVVVISIAITGAAYIGIKTKSALEDSKKSRIKKREKFLDDLADKLEKRGVGNVPKKSKK